LTVEGPRFAGERARAEPAHSLAIGGWVGRAARRGFASPPRITSPPA